MSQNSWSLQHLCAASKNTKGEDSGAMLEQYTNSKLLSRTQQKYPRRLATQIAKAATKTM